MTEDDKRQAIYNAVKALPRLRNIPVMTEQDAYSRAAIFANVFSGLAHFDGIDAAIERLYPHREELLQDIGEHAKGCALLSDIRLLMDARKDWQFIEAQAENATRLVDLFAIPGDERKVRDGKVD